MSVFLGHRNDEGLSLFYGPLFYLPDFLADWYYYFSLGIFSALDDFPGKLRMGSFTYSFNTVNVSSMWCQAVWDWPGNIVCICSELQCCQLEVQAILDDSRSAPLWLFKLFQCTICLSAVSFFNFFLDVLTLLVNPAFLGYHHLFAYLLVGFIVLSNTFRAAGVFSLLPDSLVTEVKGYH